MATIWARETTDLKPTFLMLPNMGKAHDRTAHRHDSWHILWNGKLFRSCIWLREREVHILDERGGYKGDDVMNECAELGFFLLFWQEQNRDWIDTAFLRGSPRINRVLLTREMVWIGFAHCSFQMSWVRSARISSGWLCSIVSVTMRQIFSKPLYSVTLAFHHMWWAAYNTFRATSNGPPNRHRRNRQWAHEEFRTWARWCHEDPKGSLYMRF